MTQVFYIIANCNDPFPFKVTISAAGDIKAFKYDESQTTDDWKFDPTQGTEIPIFEKKACFSIKRKDYEQLYIGSDYEEDNCHLSYDALEGGSFLIHEKKDQYVYIGTYIGRFHIPEKVLHFSGKIGNNTVNQSYVVGTKNLYLMEFLDTDGVIVPKSGLTRQDPYYQIYKKQDKKNYKPKKIKMKFICLPK
jgi:hypothetical protein